MANFFRAIWPDVKFYAAVFGVLIVFRTTAYAMYHIPSESMLPTLAVGDVIAVNKFAYGYSRHSLPFSLGPEFSTETGRVFASMPAHGDVVVFKHPRTRETYIKRVVGLPGDVVEMHDGRLFLNGAGAQTRLVSSYSYREHRGEIAHVMRYTESLPTGAHELLDRGTGFSGDDYGPITIPANMLFVMGDNRDNSADSRFDAARGVGLVPLDHVVGRAQRILFSLNMCRREPGLKCEPRPLFGPLGASR